MRWVCGDCGAAVPTGEVACLECGSEDVLRAERTVWRCQGCGQDNRDPETECWNCGETGFDRVDPDPDPDPAAAGRAGVVTDPTAADSGSTRGPGANRRSEAVDGDGGTEDGSSVVDLPGLDRRRSVALAGAVGLLLIAVLAAISVGGVPGPGDDFVGYNESVSGIELGAVEYETYRRIATTLTDGGALGRSETLSGLVGQAQYTAEAREKNRPDDMAEQIRKTVRSADVGCPDPLVYTTKLTASEGRAIDQIESDQHLAVMLADRVIESRFASDLREEGGRNQLGLDVFVAADGDVHFGIVAC